LGNPIQALEQLPVSHGHPPPLERHQASPSTGSVGDWSIALIPSSQVSSSTPMINIKQMTGED